MDNHPRFRMVDKNKGEVIGTYHTACKAYTGFHNIDPEKHPNVKMEIYGAIDSSEGQLGSYWFLGMENLEKLVHREMQEPEGPFCL